MLFPSNGLVRTTTGLMALGLDASSSSASSSIKAEKRICKPAVPFNEATFPASVVISYLADAAALGCTIKAATRIKTRNVVNKRVFIRYSPQSMKSIGYERRLACYSEIQFIASATTSFCLKEYAEDGIHSSALQGCCGEIPKHRYLIESKRK